jgi:hypothetical protein
MAAVIIIPERNACFIHIPRTGGTALSSALLRAFPLATWDGADEHISASDVRHVFPELTGCTFFTVMRNPWEIFRNRYGFVQRYVSDMPEWMSGCSAHGVRYEASLPFQSLVLWLIDFTVIATDGGFTRRYCDDDTVVFRYEDNAFVKVADLLGCELDMRTENESLVKPEWDEVSVSAVLWHCRDDVRRFGYTPPEVTL